MLSRSTIARVVGCPAHVRLLVARTSMFTIALLGGCEPSGPTGTTLTQSAPAPSRVLALGDRGSDVRAAYEYLQRYGYFDNPELRAMDPDWRPILSDAPRDPSLFDERLQEGVRTYQKLMNLPQTGAVDSLTQSAMRRPRCRHPDFDRDRQDPSRKFAVIGTKRTSNTVRYKIQSFTPDQSQQVVRDAFARAAQTWQSVTPLTIREDEVHEIAVHFYTNANIPTAWPGGWPSFSSTELAIASSPPGHRMGFNDAFNWSVATPMQQGRPDLETLALHEFGHSLGLEHSSISGSIMEQGFFLQALRRTLSADDIAAISSIYFVWEQLGQGKDIGVGANGAVWKIGMDDRVHRFIESSRTWQITDGVAAHIAVAPDGAPWVVTAAGSIFRRRDNSWWQLLPSSAKDIAVGTSGEAWIVRSDNVVCYWDESTWSWVPTSGVGKRIAGAANWLPWVVATDGRVFRRQADATWEDLGGSAADVGVGADGTAWIAATDLSVRIWNFQVAGLGAPPKREWLKVGAPAIRVAVDPDGRVWVVGSENEIFRQRRD